MTSKKEQIDYIQDFITGKTIPDIGCEGNRQSVEKFLVEKKGYDKTDVEVAVPLELEIRGETYATTIDLIVSVNNKRFMVIKCAPGSLGSREREVVSAARLVSAVQLPVAIVSDGADAMILDTVSGKKTAEGMDAIPSKADAPSLIDAFDFPVYPQDRLDKEKMIFRTYDSQDVHDCG